MFLLLHIMERDAYTHSQTRDIKFICLTAAGIHYVFTSDFSQLAQENCDIGSKF